MMRRPAAHGWASGPVDEDQVAAAETALVDLEVAVATLRVELDQVARLHHELLGPLYQHLDDLDVLLAELLAVSSQRPDDLELARRFRELVEASTLPPELTEAVRGRHARADAGDGPESESAAPLTFPGFTGPVRPTAEARRAYRDLVRQAHPDLTQDPEEKQRREAFIQRVNEAYAVGDTEALRALGAEWSVDPDAAPPPGSATRAAWLRERLGWLRSRTAELTAERDRLLATPLGELLGPESDGERVDPVAVLAELRGELMAQIGERLSRIELVRSNLSALSAEGRSPDDGPGRHRRYPDPGRLPS